MDEDGIVKKLNDKISAIRENLKRLSEQKRKELKTIKEIDHQYGNFQEILNLGYPVTPEISSYLTIVGSTVSFVSDSIEQLMKSAEEDARIYDLISTTGSSISVSASSYPYFKDYIPEKLQQKIYDQSEKDHSKNKAKILSFLNQLSPHIAKIYLSANENLDVVSSDPERGAIGLMREVINQVLHYLAPDDRVKEQVWYEPDPTSKTGITRVHRVRYIAEQKSKNAELRELIIKNADLFDETIKALNKFHAHGMLDGAESRGFFYQAEDLLVILCDAIVL